jgi:hypothetical protein
MKAILYAISIALIAAGVAVGLLVLTNAANVVIGLTLETAAILVSGGFVVLGLASVTAALFAVVDAIEVARRPAPAAAAQEIERPYIPPAAPPAAAAAAAAATTWGASSQARGSEAPEPEAPLAWQGAGYAPDGYERPADEAESAPAVEPAAKLETARTGDEPVSEAVEVIEETVVLASPDHADDLVERAYEASEVLAGEELPPAEGEDVLYVVEEKVVRGRAARVLSDGTVEAETDEGWMRFENMEHLEEYLDATAAA